MSVEKYENMNKERAINTAIAEKKKIRRVAAYCRVSTNSEEQASSLRNQREYFEEYIKREPDLILYEIFSDEGKSGTNTKNRPEFNRMMDCAKRGEIDLIVTKEISRFSRNLLECLQTTQELYNLGVEVKFITQGLSTFDTGYTIVFTLLSAFAQEESRATAFRVKRGQGQQMKKGVVFGRSLLGFDVKNGKMTVKEDEAEIVKHIFHKFVNENKGTHVIARELEEEGIAPISKKSWSNTAILRILRNEKYCGDLVQGKTYTPDFLTHKKKYNRGESEFFIVKNHHEPIVSKEIFDKANEILDSRALSQEGKAKHSNRYPFSGKIKCGICGKSFVSRFKTRKDGTKYKAWRCSENTLHGKPHVDKFGNKLGCYCNSIRDEDAMHIMQLTVEKLDVNRTKIKKNLMKTIKTVLSSGSGLSVKQLNKEMEKETEKRERLIELYTEGSITKEDYTDRKAKYDEAIAAISNKISSIKSSDIIQKNQDKLLSDIEKKIDDILSGAQYDGCFYREILDKMVIMDKYNIDVYLKLIPDKWSYVLSEAVNDSDNTDTGGNEEKSEDMGIAQSSNDKCNGSITDTDVPISVNNPFPILSGIVNL